MTSGRLCVFSLRCRSRCRAPCFHNAPLAIRPRNDCIGLYNTGGACGIPCCARSRSHRRRHHQRLAAGHRSHRCGYRRGHGLVTHYALYPARTRTRHRGQPDTVHCLGVSAQRRLSTAVRRWPVGLPSRSLITLRDHGAAVAELRSNRNGRLSTPPYGPGCGDCAGGGDMQCSPICTLGFLFLRRMAAGLCRCSILATSSPEMLFVRAGTRPLNGLIWPKAGCASIA